MAVSLGMLAGVAASPVTAQGLARENSIRSGRGSLSTPSTQPRPRADRQRDYFAGTEPDAVPPPVASPSDRDAPAGRVLSLRPAAESGSTPLTPQQQKSQTARRLRTERAQYISQQRMLRIEAMRNRGIVPLRPVLNAVPTTTSRYQQPTIIVPIYVQSFN